MPFFGNHTAPRQKYDQKELENVKKKQKGNAPKDLPAFKKPAFGPPAPKEKVEEVNNEPPNVSA